MSRHLLMLGHHGEILLGGINISTHFSRAQCRIITCLIKKRSQLVTRHEISGALWPLDTENQYSDWAIDSQVSRLRTKLLQLGIPQESFRTVKGKGFMLQQKELDV